MKAKCERCGCYVVGDYPEWMLEDPMTKFACKTCIAIDAKVDNPDCDIGCLLEKEDKEPSK